MQFFVCHFIATLFFNLTNFIFTITKFQFSCVNTTLAVKTVLQTVLNNSKIYKLGFCIYFSDFPEICHFHATEGIDLLDFLDDDYIAFRLGLHCYTLFFNFSNLIDYYCCKMSIVFPRKYCAGSKNSFTAVLDNSKIYKPVYRNRTFASTSQIFRKFVTSLQCKVSLSFLDYYSIVLKN